MSQSAFLFALVVFVSVSVSVFFSAVVDAVVVFVALLSLLLEIREFELERLSVT